MGRVSQLHGLLFGDYVASVLNTKLAELQQRERDLAAGVDQRERELVERRRELDWVRSALGELHELMTFAPCADPGNGQNV